MANTFKFGNKNWAVKEDYVLAYNDENSNFKPLPFDFTRSSTATYVDSDGLIKTAKAGHARIDYLDNADGHLLLEPSRTNLVTYSEDGSQWNTINATVASSNDSTSPSGQSSVYKVTDDTVSAQHRFDVRLAVISGTEYTFSAFVKKPSDSDINFVYLLIAQIGPTQRLYFNINEGTSLDSGGTIEDYGNGWFRISASHTATSSGNGFFGVNLTNANDNNTYTGTGNGSMFLYGIQVEAGSYATSYIPTEGSSVTRAADNVYQQNATKVIGQSEGTMYIEFVPKDTSTFQILYQVRGSSGTIGQTDIRLQSGNITALANDNGSNQFNINGGSYTAGTTYKVAIRYKLNDSKLYINGSFVGSDANCSFTASSLDQISFAENLTSFLPIADILDARLYDIGLTDAELETLTT